MLTVIHGDNIAASRNYYLEERTKHPEKIILDGTSLTLTDLIQAFSGTGLFGDQQAVFIEGLLSKKKTSKDLEKIIETLAKEQTTPIFLWEGKELTTKQLSFFKNATIKQFKIPATVFAFLDALLPRNNTKLITLYHQLLENEDVNFALFMLQRQTRMLLALLETSESSISEVKRLAPWQKGKLQKQAKSFSLEELLALHNRLYQLELDQKTGRLTLPLEKELDFLLASL